MEKATRAALKSEFDRAVMSNNSHDASDGSSTLVILDSLNYIKGYRYELYCISKAAGQRHGVIWIMGSSSDGDVIKQTASGASSPSDELAKLRNRRRRELDDNNMDGYYKDDATLDALVLRYEPPDDKNRWENPLYKVDVTGVLPWGKDGTLDVIHADDEQNSMLKTKPADVRDTEELKTNEPKSVIQSASGFKRRSKKTAASQPPASVQQQSVTPSIPPPQSTTVPTSMASRNLTAGISNTTEQSNPNKQKMEHVIDDILDSFLISTAPLQEGMSTLKLVSAESNVLNEVDSLTQRINNDILHAQKATATVSETSTYYGKKITIANGSRDRTLNLTKPLQVDELRHCRRQFLKWISTHPMQAGTIEEDVVDVYVSFIESNV
jgi:tRNA uridine 5-carbamoylmethylation protein Kti12